MKKILIILLTLALLGCSPENRYRFRIEGNIDSVSKTYDHGGQMVIKKVTRQAVAYTDTIHGYNDDSVWYFNSDGSKMCILAPYTIYKIK